MLKIAYVHGNSNIIAGQEKTLLNIVKEIKKINFDPVVILPSNGLFSRELTNNNIKVDFIKLHRFSKKNPFLFFLTVLSLYIYIKKMGIKIIHVSGIYPNQYCCLAAKFARIPVICHVHSTVYKPQEIKISLLKFADIVIAVSNGVRKNIEKSNIVNTNKIKVIYNGIDEKDYSVDEKRLTKLKEEFHLEKNHMVIGQIGQVIELKGVYYFIKMAGEIIKFNKNVRFLLVGDDKYEPGFLKKMKDLVNELNLSEYFIFTGFRTDIPEIISLMDVVVLASLLEGLGNVLLEAMLLNKPVVGSNIPGVNEIVEDNVTGFLVPARDYIVMANRVLILVNDKTRSNDLINAARKKVLGEFSLTNQINQVSNIYKNLLIN